MSCMAHKYYIYDAANYRFEPFAPSRKEIMKRVGLMLTAAAVVAGFFLVLNYTLLGDLSYTLAQRRQRRLMDRLMDYRLQLQKMELSLEKVHQSDQSYFRSILNLPRMKQEEWDGPVRMTTVGLGMPMGLRQAVALTDRLNHRFDLQKKSLTQLAAAAEKNQDELHHVPTLKPLAGRILSGFGYRADPIAGGLHFHPGLDIHGPYGAPIKAVAEGTVITSGWSDGGYGIEVEIDHGYGYVTKYAHLSRTNVPIGKKVKRKEVIGFLGNTGYSIGPHLHYEVIKNGIRVDPRDYVLNE